MGFREYNPGLNRFLSRDMYDGALKDMALGSDPWTVNRYAFAGGNPITGIELDGHCPMADEGGCDTSTAYSGPIQPSTDSGPTQPEATQPSEPSIGQKLVHGLFGGGKSVQQNVGEELFVKPAVETYEACKSAIQMESYATNWQQCKTGAALTALGFTGGGKVFGVGVRTAEGLAAARLEATSASLLIGRTASGADDLGRLTTSQQRSLRSLQSQAEKHRIKLDAYRADPDAYDNLGILLRAPTPEIRQRIIDGRIRHLETEIRTFQDQIDKLLGGG